MFWRSFKIFLKTTLWHTSELFYRKSKHLPNRNHIVTLLIKGKVSIYQIETTLNNSTIGKGKVSIYQIKTTLNSSTIGKKGKHLSN